LLLIGNKKVLTMKQTSVTIKEETLQQIAVIVGILGTSKTKFLEELISHVFDRVQCFESANITYYTSILNNKLELYFVGKSKFKTGKVTSESELKEVETNVRK